MKKCVDMTKAMCQKYLVQTFDQQLYSIAKQVARTMPDTFRNHILRLAGFHTPSCYIAAIGKLWGDVGSQRFVSRFFCLCCWNRGSDAQWKGVQSSCKGFDVGV